MLTISVAGCAPSKGLDVEALEADLTLTVLPDHPGLVNAVDCPEPLDPAPGDQVECAAMIGLDPANVQVVFGTDRGGGTATVTTRLVNATEVERLVTERFVADLSLATTVQCGQPVLVVGPDGRVRCTATDHRGVERGLVIVVGADGGLGIDLG